MKTRTPMTSAVKALAVDVINTTPDGSVGYDEAIGRVGENWADFAAVGHGEPKLYEQVADYIRWAKWEGFCVSSTLTL